MTQRSEQLERLLSERLDGDLTADQLTELQGALSENPEAAATARQYERLNDLLAGWRALPGDIDWQEYARRLAGGVAKDVIEPSQSAAQETQGDPVDGLIQEWAKPLPDVDWDGLRSRISAAVREETAVTTARAAGSRKRWRRTAAWAVTIGTPLAAAALIAIVAWLPRTDLPITSGGGGSVQSVVVVSFEMPDSTGRIAVTFDEAPMADTGETPVPQPPGGVAIAIGPSTAEHGETIDEALFY